MASANTKYGMLVCIFIILTSYIGSHLRSLIHEGHPVQIRRWSFSLSGHLQHSIISRLQKLSGFYCDSNVGWLQVQSVCDDCCSVLQVIVEL